VKNLYICNIEHTDTDKFLPALSSMQQRTQLRCISLHCFGARWFVIFADSCR